VIDHVILNVTDIEAAKTFYLAALAPLRYAPAMEFPDGVGFAQEGGHGPDFWIARRGEASAPVHVAFSAPDRPTVDAFHAAALAAGGTDHGAPGLRPHYHEHYYGAFVLDPDGNNIEAVCHLPA
jgi:catechol 2,3-dioxygenase-like lactoylglutathione lyase family enzyme